MDFYELKESVNKVVFDNERLVLVESVMPKLTQTLTLKHIKQLLREFSFDSGKISALKLVAPKVSVCCASEWIDECAEIFSEFSFGNSKVEALQLLKTSCIVESSVTHDQVKNLLQKMSFGNHKLRALQVLQSLTLQFIGNRETTIDCFTFYSNKQNALAVLQGTFDENASAKRRQKRSRKATWHDIGISEPIAPTSSSDCFRNTLSCSTSGLMVNGKQVRGVTSMSSLRQTNGELFIAGEEYVVRDNIWVPLRETEQIEKQTALRLSDITNVDQIEE